MDGTPILATRGLGLHIGGARILEDVTLEARPGELVAIIGPNGAGKTSLFNLISGLLEPTEGTIELAGEDITSHSPSRRSRAGLGRTFQISSVFPRLTALENARLAAEAGFGGTLRVWRRADTYGPALERASWALERVGLAFKAALPAGALAHGDQRKLELAMVLAGKPKVVLLDEPMAGVSAEDIDGLTALISSVHRDESKTILLVEHRMEVVVGLAERIAVLHHGRVLAFDEPDAVIQDKTVQAAYLGDPL